jgi:hypothetical protein
VRPDLEGTNLASSTSSASKAPPAQVPG